MLARVRKGGRVSPWFLARIAYWMSQFAFVLCLLPLCTPAFAQQPAPVDVPGQSDRRIPERTPTNVASLQGRVRDQQSHAVPGATLTIRSRDSARTYISTT